MLLPRILLLLTCWLAAGVVAATPVTLPAGSASVSLTPALGVVLHAPEHWTLADARAATSGFVVVGHANHGLTGSVAWFRVVLHNDAAQARELLLGSAFPLLDEVDLYLVHADGSVDHHRAGAAVPRAQRSIDRPGVLLPVQVAAGEQATLYLRVRAAGVMHVPLVLYGNVAHASLQSGSALWQGLFYGLALGLLLYNAFLFVFARDRAFLYYVLTGLTALLYFAGYDDLLATGLADGRYLQQRGLFIGTALSVACTLQFGRHFLLPAALWPRLDATMRNVAVAALVLAVLVAIPQVPLAACVPLLLLASIGMTGLLLAAGWLGVRAARPLATWFLGAMLLHLATLLLVAAATAGFPADAMETASTVHRLSFLMVMGAFSLALGERIRNHERERRAAEVAATEARADSRARSEFVAGMSHDLRTPMTGVLGMAELLEMSPLETSQRRQLATLRYSAEMLLSLINDILDHARLEAGLLRLRQDAFDLWRLVDDLRTLFDRQPRDAATTLHVDVDAALPRVLVGDAGRIRQVLVNMVAYALRRGGNPVLIQVLPGARSGSVLFRVRDDGAPLSPADCERLLRFAPTGAQRSGGDTGLAIATELCGCMGGTLVATARSDGKPGIELAAELPLHAADP